MKAIILMLGLFLHSDSMNSVENQMILQEVLNIEEFKQYISKNPRFVGSQNPQIILLSHEMIDKSAKLEINQIPIKIVDSETAKVNEKIFFIEIQSFKIRNKKASLSLNYKNARLYFEENKRITMVADLKKVDGEWLISQYEVKEISISD
ncbi:hypothetical protein JKA74_07180 [Marivirga sp. S37H4]|uniref:Uncharacterized protein n=1 Tax=Marivirga aurantiaca TaxID=2802615 RepID=A0A934WXJ2_9BACT|nr:hypothetical protein [Marivirga aurantiaca]MBK6264814.1 hypothetical protein [Marivirga aurantiaca]